MTQQPSSLLRVRHPEQPQQALALLCQTLNPQDRQRHLEGLLSRAAAGQGTLDGLFAAYRADELVGAALLEMQAGHAGALMPPICLANEPAETAAALIEAAVEFAQSRGAAIVQAVVALDRRTDDLRKAGFVHAADLRLLYCPDRHFPARLPKTDLSFESYTPQIHRRLAQIVERTYEGTLDCPKLNGMRTVDDVLAGYRANGVFAPDRWLIARQPDRDVGCLLLADLPEADQWQLDYVGLVPAARGCGWGRQLVRHAQWLTGQARRTGLVLSVDARNLPALRIYEELGFLDWNGLAVYFRFFHQRLESPALVE